MTWVQENALTYNNTQYGFKIENSVLVCYAGGQDLWRISLTDLLQNPVLAALTTGVSLQFGLWQDQKASGTAGGDFTSGAWQTRTLNTEVFNTISGSALAANQVTLPAGTYFLLGHGPAYKVGRHQLRIYDVTSASAVAIGSNAYCTTAADDESSSHAIGFVTLAAPAAIEVQHRCEATFAASGFGLATSWGIESYGALSALKLVTT